MERELLLLGLLRRHEMHGYQLNEYIDRQMAFCVDIKRPTAYYVLDKLCREGYVKQARERAGNRPERRIYRITQAGEQRFTTLLRANLAAYHTPMYPDDIGMIFGAQLPPEEVAQHLHVKRTAVEARQATMQQLHERMPDAGHRAVVEHHLVHLEAELRWLDTLLQQFDTATE